MQLLGIYVKFRMPVHVARVTGWWCADCVTYRKLTRSGRCERCYRSLRRVAP